MNHGLLPSITPILEDLHGLGFQNKIGAAFGSYGWSGEATKDIEAHLERSKVGEGGRRRERQVAAHRGGPGALPGAGTHRRPGRAGRLDGAHRTTPRDEVINGCSQRHPH